LIKAFSTPNRKLKIVILQFFALVAIISFHKAILYKIPLCVILNHCFKIG
jgi:hypothetical protein